MYIGIQVVMGRTCSKALFRCWDNVARKIRLLRTNDFQALNIKAMKPEANLLPITNSTKNMLEILLLCDPSFDWDYEF